MKASRGIVETALLYVLAGVFAGTVLGSWKPLSYFRKPPPTAQLTELQAKLDAQKAAADQAAKEAEAAKLAERAKLEAQIRAAQADNLGAVTALAKVKPANQSPEVKLAARMAQRVSLKLATAIGNLPEAEREAMVELIDQALSDKQAEIDEANRKLAAMDADFKAVTGEREKLKAEIPKLTERAARAEETAKATELAVKQKTEEVKTWANKADAALRDSGSLMSSIKRAALMLGLGYVFLAFVLPAIVKAMDTGNPLKAVLRNASGYLLNPILHHDAAKKIARSKPAAK